jgi:LacI family transcriptional regulator
MPARKPPAPKQSSPRSSANLEVIAQKAGVSKAAVSLALNNRGRLSEETRLRIQSIAEEIGYKHKKRKSHVASRDQESGVLVLLDRQFFRAGESYFTRIVAGVEEEAVSRGYKVIFTTLAEDQLSGSPESLLNRSSRPQGLIVVGVTRSSFLKRLKAFNIPTILVACGRQYDHRHDVVVHDDYEGMELIVEHLSALGHRRIAFLGGAMEHLSGATRLRAYKIHMDELTGHLDRSLIEVVQGETNRKAGQEACYRLLDRDPSVTAMICLTDEMAAGAMIAIRRRGLSTPGDISVVSFDNKPFSALLDPSLTTVQISCEEMGRVATDLLGLRMGNMAVSHALRVLVGSELVVRSSTGPAPVHPR